MLNNSNKIKEEIIKQLKEETAISSSQLNEEMLKQLRDEAMRMRKEIEILKNQRKW